MDSVYRNLSFSDKNAIKEVVDIVCNSLKDNNFFIPYSDEEYESYLNNDDGIMIGAYFKDKLVGVGALLFESEKRYELDGCVILPEYRNKGIQKELIKRRLDFAKDAGISNVFVMSHPENKISLDNLKKLGFTEIETKLLSNGKLRTIMEIELNGK